jgi:nucleotide-binding universal stress UspA family protein
MLGHVMVAYDGSEGARHALTFARRCVAPDGRITLVRAVELPVPYVVGGFDGVVTLGELPTTEELERERTRLLASVADLGERATVRVELGHPVEVITRLAEDLAPDAVVVGARGLGAVTRFLVGSVSDRIVHHCSRPVVVVR